MEIKKYDFKIKNIFVLTNGINNNITSPQFAHR